MNDQYEGFIKLVELIPDKFKYLIFVQGLVSTKDAEIRRRVLNKLENESNLTLQNKAEDCQRFINVRQDAKDIEVSCVSHIKKKSASRKESEEKKILTPVMHVENYIYFYFQEKNKKCFCCKKGQKKNSL